MFFKRPEDPRDMPSRTPACFNFDKIDDPSDFGSQVLLTIELDAAKWSATPEMNEFYHPKLGQFRVYDDGRVRHFSSTVQGFVGGQQRALTGGDQRRIVDALRAMLLKGIDTESATRTAEPTTKANAHAQAIARAYQRAGGLVPITAAQIPCDPTPWYGNHVTMKE